MEIFNHDVGRSVRCGIPEVVYGEGKNSEDLSEIVKQVLKKSGKVIITRIDEEKTAKVLKEIDSRRYDVVRNSRGRVLVIKKRKKHETRRRLGVVGILTAGTSDIPVAEEAKTIAEELGCEVVCRYDVGVAGIHRTFKALKEMKDVNVYIVVAGMEGALPSVVSGLVKAPVIAVPTSVGYGTAEKGRTALNTMLNSCTPLAVVNIDNGYGAAVLAYKILQTCKVKEK